MYLNNSKIVTRLTDLWWIFFYFSQNWIITVLNFDKLHVIFKYWHKQDTCLNNTFYKSRCIPFSLYLVSFSSLIFSVTSIHLLLSWTYPSTSPQHLLLAPFRFHLLSYQTLTIASPLQNKHHPTTPSWRRLIILPYIISTRSVSKRN